MNTIEPFDSCTGGRLIVVSNCGLAFAFTGVFVFVDPYFGRVGFFVIFNDSYRAKVLLQVFVGHGLGQILNKYRVFLNLNARITAAISRSLLLITIVAATTVIAFITFYEILKKIYFS